jgi:hypothetical protein
MTMFEERANLPEWLILLSTCVVLSGAIMVIIGSVKQYRNTNLANTQYLSMIKTSMFIIAFFGIPTAFSFTPLGSTYVAHGVISTATVVPTQSKGILKDSVEVTLNDLDDKAFRVGAELGDPDTLVGKKIELSCAEDEPVTQCFVEQIH